MQNNTPLISVIMGVYYRRDDLYLLRRSVESILNQSFTDFEFLICDGGSTLAACNYLDEAANRDNRIRLIRDVNVKTDLAHKLNACLRYARGKYIARMDDDDFSHPDRFEKQIAFLEKHPEISFVGCNVNLMCDGTQVGQRVLPERPTVHDFYMVQPYIHPTLIFRREVFENTAGYSEEKHTLLCEDYDLLLRLYTEGCVGCNLQEILFDYTISETENGKRKMVHRCNEVVTRWNRFRDLKCLPKALPYVIKPLAVGVLPKFILAGLKARRRRKHDPCC